MTGATLEQTENVQSVQQHSYSRRKLFNQCKKAFSFKYIEKVPERKSLAARTGSVVHDFQYQYVNHLYETNQSHDSEKFTQLRDDILADEHAEVREDALNIMNGTLADRTYRWDTKSNVSMEERWAFDSEWNLHTGLDDDAWFNKDPDAVKFRLRLDMVYFENNKLWIQDYKTNWRIMSQSEVENDDQLKIYAYAVSQKYPDITDIVLMLDFVRFDFQRIVEINVADARGVKKMLEKSIEKIESEADFIPEPGQYCDWCTFTSICPTFQRNSDEESVNIELNRPDPITSREQAKELAEKRKHLLIAADQLTEKLKRWAEVNGDIPLSHENLGFHPKSRTSVTDTRKAAGILLNSGMSSTEVWDALTFPKTKYYGLAKKANLSDETRDAFVEENVYTEFSYQKTD